MKADMAGWAWDGSYSYSAGSDRVAVINYGVRAVERNAGVEYIGVLAPPHRCRVLYNDTP